MQRSKHRARVAGAPGPPAVLSRSRLRALFGLRARLRYWPGVMPVDRRNERTKFDSEENPQSLATSAIDFPAIRSDLESSSRNRPMKRLGDCAVAILNMREKWSRLKDAAAASSSTVISLVRFA